MELVAPLTQLETAAAVMLAARPTLVTHGVSIAAWKIGGFSHTHLLGYIKSDGTNETIGDPTGGSLGVEVWMYKADLAGTSRWFLVGYLNGGNDIDIVAASGGFMFELELSSVGSRLCLAGAPAGAHPPSYYFEPLEVHTKS